MKNCFFLIFLILISLSFNSCIKNDLKDLVLNQNPFDTIHSSLVALKFDSTDVYENVGLTYKTVFIYFSINLPVFDPTIYHFTDFKLYGNGKYIFHTYYIPYHPNWHIRDEPLKGSGKVRYEVSIVGTGGESKKYFLTEMTF